MKHHFSILLVLSLFVFASCKKDKSNYRSVSGPQTTLAWQECADFSNFGLTVCFIGANEYRCPCTADCVWEGAIDFTLRVQGPDIDTTVIVSTNTLVKPAPVQVGNTYITVADDSGIFCQHYGELEYYKVKVTLAE